MPHFPTLVFWEDDFLKRQHTFTQSFPEIFNARRRESSSLKLFLWNKWNSSIKEEHKSQTWLSCVSVTHSLLSGALRLFEPIKILQDKMFLAVHVFTRHVAEKHTKQVFRNLLQVKLNQANTFRADTPQTDSLASQHSG